MAEINHFSTVVGENVEIVGYYMAKINVSTMEILSDKVDGINHCPQPKPT